MESSFQNCSIVSENISYTRCLSLTRQIDLNGSHLVIWPFHLLSNFQRKIPRFWCLPTRTRMERQREGNHWLVGEKLGEWSIVYLQVIKVFSLDFFWSYFFFQKIYVFCHKRIILVSIQLDFEEFSDAINLLDSLIKEQNKW